MAVVPRKRKSGTVYYVTREWKGKAVWELVGPRKREAEQRDREMAAQIAAGEYIPPAERRANTVLQECTLWGQTRTNASADDERRLIRLHVERREWLALMPVAEMKPRHVKQLVDELRTETKPNGGRRLSDKTIANLLGVLKLVFDAAILAERCATNPVQLPPGYLDRNESQEKEVYSASELMVLTRHAKIPWPIRVLNALCLLAGLREGEAVGRRWRDLTEGADLHAMDVKTQYDGKRLKTKRPRVVPIHPELARILTEWAQEGFELYTGRKPTPDDFIVPNVSKRAKAQHHTRSSYYKQFCRTAALAGVRPRSLHSTRHTFITLCRRGNCNKDNLRTITHNPKGDIVDRYTHIDWKPLCDVVMCLSLDTHLDPHPGAGNGGGSSARKQAFLPHARENSPGIETGSSLQFPAPPLLSGTKQASSESRVKTRVKVNRWNLGELGESNAVRKRALLSLQGADPDGAKPGLALARGLDAAYLLGAGDASARGRVERALTEALQAIGQVGNLGRRTTTIRRASR